MENSARAWPDAVETAQNSVQNDLLAHIWTECRRTTSLKSQKNLDFPAKESISRSIGRNTEKKCILERKSGQKGCPSALFVCNAAPKKGALSAEYCNPVFADIGKRFFMAVFHIHCFYSLFFTEFLYHMTLNGNIWLRDNQ